MLLKGKYETGMLFVRSDFNIVLEKDSALYGSTKIDDSSNNDASFLDAVNAKRGKALLIAYKCQNVKITGEGEIC